MQYYVLHACKMSWKSAPLRDALEKLKKSASPARTKLLISVEIRAVRGNQRWAVGPTPAAEMPPPVEAAWPAWPATSACRRSPRRHGPPGQTASNGDVLTATCRKRQRRQVPAGTGPGGTCHVSLGQGVPPLVGGLF
jgi:hypothetical protein